MGKYLDWEPARVRRIKKRVDKKNGKLEEIV